jgi:hypothetical protein
VGVYTPANGVGEGDWYDVFATDGQPGVEGNFIRAWADKDETGRQWILRLHQEASAEDTGCTDSDSGSIVYRTSYGPCPPDTECPISGLGFLTLSATGPWSDGEEDDPSFKISVTGTNYNVTWDGDHIRFDLTASGEFMGLIVQVRGKYEGPFEPATFKVDDVISLSAIKGPLTDLTLRIVEDLCDLDGDGICDENDLALFSSGGSDGVPCWGAFRCESLFKVCPCDMNDDRMCVAQEDGFLFTDLYEAANQPAPVINGVAPTADSGFFERAKKIIISGRNFGDDPSDADVRIGSERQANKSVLGLGKDLTRKDKFVRSWTATESAVKLAVPLKWGCEGLEKYIWIEKDGKKSNPWGPITISPHAEKDVCLAP